MTRKKRLKLNTISSLIYQIVSLVSGFVLPRLILKYYGSDVNGLLSSITQFLALITLCECGVGAVVQSALYKPIAENDNNKISEIYVSAKKFFNKIAIILAVYIIILIVVFPKIINNQYGYIYTGVLILAIAISSFAQYYFGIVYKLILNSAQLVYVQMVVGILVLIGNAVISVVLMKNGYSIQIVKIVTSLIFLIQPVIYWYFVEKRFQIDKKIQYVSEPIVQKWNGLFQHIATVVLENTDVLVLTALSTLSNVSIYAVYHLVTNGIKLAFVSITTGIKSLLGDMYARDERESLIKVFSSFEMLIHAVVTYIYIVAAVLITPFVSVYTKSITDANYIQPVFGYLMCLAMMIYMIRIPYSYMILAAGHYRETQISALIEVGINILISIALVYKFGLIGVAFGTIAGMLYRTIYFAIYLSRNILNRNMQYFRRHMLCDILCIAVVFITTRWVSVICDNYLEWIILAIVVSVISLIECFCVNCICFKKDTIEILRRLKK